MSGLYTAIAATVISGIGMTVNLTQAARQRRKANQAEADSKRLMQQARAKMQKDAIQNLKVPTEAYERAFKANTAQQKQALDSLMGSDARTLAAGIGKVGAIGTGSNELQRIAMGEDLYQLGLAKAESTNQIRDELVGMDVGQARDQMTMAGDLREASAASTAAGISAGISAAQSAASAVPTYTKGAADRRAASIYKGGNFEVKDTNINSPTYGQMITNPSIPKTPEMIMDRDVNSPTYGQQIAGKETFYPGAPLKGETGFIDPKVREKMKDTETGFIKGKERKSMRSLDKHEIIDALARQGYTRKQVKEMLNNSSYDWESLYKTIRVK